MKKFVGNASGAVTGGSSRHHPFATSEAFSGAQNSSARPVVSWYQAGKPPTVGSMLTGPALSSTACAEKLLVASASASPTARAPTLFLTCLIIANLPVTKVTKLRNPRKPACLGGVDRVRRLAAFAPVRVC